MRWMSSSTRSSDMPTRTATARYGSASMGSPSWMASSTSRSSSVSAAMLASKLEPDIDEEFLKRREVDRAQSGATLDRVEGALDVSLVVGRDHKPHVVRVRALVVV